MADDRMKNDDLDRNLGGAGRQDQDQDKYGQGGQKSPGRNKQDDDLSRGQHESIKQGEPQHMKDDFGTSGNKDVGQGGRNR